MVDAGSPWLQHGHKEPEGKLPISIEIPQTNNPHY
jgi:hypothetical protein